MDILEIFFMIIVGLLAILLAISLVWMLVIACQLFKEDFDLWRK